MKARLLLPIAALVGFVTPAQAVVGVAVPGSTSVGFVTPIVIVQAGQTPTFANADVSGDPHNFRAATAYGPNTNPWCGTYAINKCPLFWSKTTTAGSEPTTPVLGVDKLAPGSYDFHCSVHPNSMVGTLMVV